MGVGGKVGYHIADEKGCLADTAVADDEHLEETITAQTTTSKTSVHAVNHRRHRHITEPN
jgi:hypothetical protein